MNDHKSNLFKKLSKNWSKRTCKCFRAVLLICWNCLLFISIMNFSVIAMMIDGLRLNGSWHENMQWGVSIY